MKPVLTSEHIAQLIGRFPAALGTGKRPSGLMSEGQTDKRVVSNSASSASSRPFPYVLRLLRRVN